MRDLSLLFSLFLAVAPIDSALADCSRRTDVATEFHQSDLVFVGKVTSAKQLSPEPSDGSLLGTSYQLEVIEQFRGEPRHTVLVFSENDSGRFEMRVGETFLLFARLDPKTLVGPAYWVYNCGFSGVARASPKTLAMVRKLTNDSPDTAGHPTSPAGN
jgi:hypothetical protein